MRVGVKPGDVDDGGLDLAGNLPVADEAAGGKLQLVDGRAGGRGTRQVEGP